MRIKFDFYGKNKELLISNINVFYGYNNSGKTRLGNIIHDGFTQKSKTYFAINGFQVFKNQYEVMRIDSTESIEDHIKMSSKSLLKKLYFDTILSKVDHNNTFTSFIAEKFKLANEAILELFENLRVGVESLVIKLDEESIDDIINNSLKVSFSNQHLSSSTKRMLLYKTINEYVVKTATQKVIIIDDFDLYLDESSIQDFLNIIINDKENIYILFSNKAESLPYMIDNTFIYNIRETKIIDLTNLKKIIRYVLGTKKEKHTFEEFYINEGLLVLNEEVETLIQKIKSNSIINLGRMLVNKDYSLEEKGLINITPVTEIERTVLLFIEQLLKNE